MGRKRSKKKRAGHRYKDPRGQLHPLEVELQYAESLLFPPVVRRPLQARCCLGPRVPDFDTPMERYRRQIEQNIIRLANDGVDDLSPWQRRDARMSRDMRRVCRMMQR